MVYRLITRNSFESEMFAELTGSSALRGPCLAHVSLW